MQKMPNSKINWTKIRNVSSTSNSGLPEQDTSKKNVSVFNVTGSDFAPPMPKKVLKMKNVNKIKPNVE